MIRELHELVDRQKLKRSTKTSELVNILSTRKQEQLDQFVKEYAIAVEELAAREGTGKKYGRPKRLAQERLRTEMTKCEKAQDAINHKIGRLNEMHEMYIQRNSDDAYFY